MWEQSNKEWVDRWDAYLYANSPNDRVHWFSITNSFLVVIFLSILIGIILIRNLRKDIAMYVHSLLLTPSLTLTYSLTYSLTHSLTHILTHSLTHSLRI